jgi:hypothetical protein
MKPLFLSLLRNYPSERSPCDGPYTNQCAIRMSIALTGASLSLDNYEDPRCKHGHARGAESLANWLWRRHLGRPKIYKDGAKGKQEIKNMTGIIFFKDCFQRKNETSFRGDHIDLWHIDRTMTFDDRDNKAKEVWFWQLV